jgi:hypothetical protein
VTEMKARSYDLALGVMIFAAVVTLVFVGLGG